MNIYKGMIKVLAKHEVFVFGSNLQGFHGAGAAGFATFGIPGNVWRQFDYGSKPTGWKGLWTVKGTAEGSMRGTQGVSYAIPTVARPGAKRSIPLETIHKSVMKFYDVAMRNPKWKFYVAFGGSNHLNGYSQTELGHAFYAEGIPGNVWFSEIFAPFIKP